MAGLLRGGRLGQLGELLQRQVSGLAVAHKTSRKNRMGKSMGKCGENQGEIYGKMWGRCLLELQKANKSGRIADVPARTPEQKS